MLTVTRNSNAYKGTVFFEPLVGHIRYWLWRDGIIPSGIGAYAENARIDRDQLRSQLGRGGFFSRRL